MHADPRPAFGPDLWTGQLPTEDPYAVVAPRLCLDCGEEFAAGSDPLCAVCAIRDRRACARTNRVTVFVCALVAAAVLLLVGKNLGLDEAERRCALGQCPACNVETAFRPAEVVTPHVWTPTPEVTP